MKTVKINDKEYEVDALTDYQRVVVNHIMDIQRKIEKNRFMMDQMMVGHDSFIQMFEKSFESQD